MPQFSYNLIDIPYIESYFRFKHRDITTAKTFPMNKYESIPDRIIDLHGYTASEAEETLRALLKTADVRHVRIIVGKGNHRAGGPVLSDFVKRYLFMRNIRFSPSKLKDGGEGALEVFLA